MNKISKAFPRISFKLISVIVSLLLVLGSLSFISGSKVLADCGTHSGLFSVFASYGHYDEEDEDHECPEEPSPSPSPSPSDTPSPTPSVSPTPTPSASPSTSPSPSPSPEPCEEEYVEEECEDCDEECDEDECEDECEGDECDEEEVLGVKTPTVQPETGLSVLGLATMASAAPLGILLTKFGRGFRATSKKEENLSSYASDLVKSRVQK